MTCTQMLERLIEADPDALAGRGSSDVATHVRECARCSAVARQLLADTRVLAATVRDGDAIVRRVRPAPVVLAVAAAATVAFLLLPQQPTARPALAPARSVAESGPARSVENAPARSAAENAFNREARAERNLARAYPAASPITVKPMDLSSSESTPQQVAVTPPAGKRAAVMRTGDPSMTVIWVY